MRVEGGKLVLGFIPNPLSLAVKIKKWAKTTVEEFEKESEEERMSSSTIKVLLDSTYILPSFGVEVEGLSDEHVAQLREATSHRNSHMAPNARY
jgi:hypothetical protein